MRNVTILVLLITSTVYSGKVDTKQLEKELELKSLQSAIETAQDSLEQLITKQYSFKQRTVEQRESDKEEIDQQLQIQETLENELARTKEERLNREQTLEDERKNLSIKQDEWKNLREQIKDLFQKDADVLIESFPLDQELKRLEIEKIRSSIENKRSIAMVFNSFLNYRLKWFRQSDSISLIRSTVMGEDGSPKHLIIARFGNAFSYGLDSTSGALYYLRQTGRLGAERYSVERIMSEKISEQLTGLFTKWMQKNQISGEIPVEVLQNDQARMLISGTKQSEWKTLFESLEKGGWVMIPLLLLPLWAIYLFLLKIIQFWTHSIQMKSQLKKAMPLINEGKFDSALESIKRYRKGIMAHIIKSTIERRKNGRNAGERAVGELLSLEIPALNRNLNTLAVIAGAAPLLGLLGTISGMITLFAAVTHYGTGDPKFLAGGISEALITAKTGLAVAIPTLFVHDFLRTAKDKLMANMEKNAITLLNAIYPED
jgi:biopolymer transport protein ExbB